MKDLWKIATPISTAAIILGIIWLANGCMERGERFKMECMRAGGSVVTTSQQDVCIAGGAVTRSKP